MPGTEQLLKEKIEMTISVNLTRERLANLVGAKLAALSVNMWGYFKLID
jgi:hypothetical protein